jgi:hypothetical protein
MKPRVYIETSVVSYLTARSNRDLIVAAHQQITTELWARRDAFEFYASELVLAEAGRGDSHAAAQRLAVLNGIPLLKVSSQARDLGKLLVQELAIPSKAIEDAYHVAVAAVQGMDYLITWNCTHIANLQMQRKIERICIDAGYIPAVIGTPEELLATAGE